MNKVLATATKAMLRVFGQLNRQDLVDLTGKSVRTVCRFLADAQNLGLLFYDSSRKRILPIDNQFDDLNESLRYIRACQTVQNTGSASSLMSVLDASAWLEPNLDYPAIQTLCQALRDKRQVFCRYRSKTGEMKNYTLSPLHLVYISYRYHFRAYVHESKKFSDFVLGRFHSADKLSARAVSDKDDKEWHQSVTLHFRLHPGQSDTTRESTRLEWNLLYNSDLKKMPIKQALKKYVVRQMTTNDYQTGIPLWIYEENLDV